MNPNLLIFLIFLSFNNYWLATQRTVFGMPFLLTISQIKLLFKAYLSSTLQQWERKGVSSSNYITNSLLIDILNNFIYLSESVFCSKCFSYFNLSQTVSGSR